MKASVGNFYFLSDQYFVDFPDPNIMRNKETIDGIAHSRPCFYSFYDTFNGLYWLIPISSKVDKYKAIYEKSIAKYGKCDTLFFATVMGKERTFLIQNMCPTTMNYIVDEYINPRNNMPVKINEQEEIVLLNKAKVTLFYVRRGNKRLIFPDVLSIEKQLLGR